MLISKDIRKQPLSTFVQKSLDLNKTNSIKGGTEPNPKPKVTPQQEQSGTIIK